MDCSLRGICGGCSLRLPYRQQLTNKVQHFCELFSELPKPSVFASPPSAFRARAEFRVVFENGKLSYCLCGKDKKIKISSCPILLQPLQQLFSPLLALLEQSEILAHKLFGIEFLASTHNEVLMTLLYHKKLDDSWLAHAQNLLFALTQSVDSTISLIGRARKQKVVLGACFVHESFTFAKRCYDYRHYESAFTQPNPFANAQMLEWACAQSAGAEGDLLELYCGLGNFTIPLSRHFEKVLATEIAKISLQALGENLALNDVQNVQIARLSALEMRDALDNVRPFRRLAHVDLSSYRFETLFVDPPRAGLGDCAAFAQRFSRILYVSCNPMTLRKDLETLAQTHHVQALAVFDQFPYTPHLESAVLLSKSA
ncbi:MAG: tRNA (uridine(54)-C5)-methyltransferase TrmA [Helicobacter sp.]|nr:tRNA (uridine(54)-C5)-methyltransferase TrmA [Helicobacter sp.]